ncbi:MAG: DUF4198 domain-containing protein [Phycisphaeraceae bacterium]|nr:MAG: DUF4198 domain-containing protein [Phycisphaeraceae bacterium]
MNTLAVALAVVLLFFKAASPPTLGPDHAQTPVLGVSALSVAVGQPVTLSLEQPAPGGATPLEWPDSPAWFFVRLAGTQHNRSADEALTREDRTRLIPASPGVAMIGIDLAPANESWDAERFREFTGDAAKPAAVEVHRSATALVRVTHADGSPAHDHTPTSKSGQQVEIRPLMDPTSLLPGSDLPVRVYVRGVGAAGARVIARHALTGERVETVADDKGIAHLRITHPGVWTIESRSLVAPRDQGQAWIAAFATLTFEAPERREGAPK